MIKRININADGFDELREWESVNGEYVRFEDVRTLEARNSELLEALKKAHEILLHEMDNGRTPSMLQGVGLGYFEDVIAGINRDS